MIQGGPRENADKWLMMEVAVQLNYFFMSIASDERICSTHISVYMALLLCWMENNLQNPFIVNREEVMRAAKISARTTYNKCMGELHRYGYIKYTPSYNFYLGSMVRLISEKEVVVSD